jgi:hypothetical protein
MSSQLEPILAHRYPVAHAALSPKTKSGRVLGLFLVEVTDESTLVVVGAGLILLSKHYVPCDSSYEVEVAELLVKEKRRFEKPMAPDPATGLQPDFVPQDTERPTHMEVFGMDIDKYNEDKRAKLKFYDSPCGIELWKWDVLHDLKCPPFPPAIR